MSITASRVRRRSIGSISCQDIASTITTTTTTTTTIGKDNLHSRSCERNWALIPTTRHLSAEHPAVVLRHNHPRVLDSHLSPVATKGATAVILTYASSATCLPVSEAPGDQSRIPLPYAHRSRTRTGYILPRAAVLLLLVMVLLCALQPVSATSMYQGPLPQERRPSVLANRKCGTNSASIASTQRQGSTVSKQISSEHPTRWNTECSVQREQLYARNADNIRRRGQQLHKRRVDGQADGSRDTVTRALDNTTFPLPSFQALAAVNSTNMTCNGRADLCDLRYNQVTYPGTHNSAAYDLKYDCQLATETCLQSKTVCTAQAQNCSMGWETRCTKMSNTCVDRLPGWLNWLCGAFTSTCMATEQVCQGWEQICTSSLEVCTLWGSACLGVVPDWALPCLWENQPDHTISQQLADGELESASWIWGHA
ncbi:hypothetical protein BC939DRAFT_237838 [Gamsiella multidivaricata]|uniref:uncharacterized protein n=1 Tax=Gamsiella multidivaricata TaxID=101098 RepID=UPI0022204F55|nr:uncharacterized protein BC939DRAFT_237838 [Gamsiella multidivaricata]KAI7820289.1 hypothetical protein BC939DRAFT_237838 [Gamsiella multidivaricata]